MFVLLLLSVCLLFFVFVLYCFVFNFLVVVDFFLLFILANITQ